MSNKSNETNEMDQIKTTCLSLSDTAKKIRYLHSLGYDTKTIYKMINQFGVTTKLGGEIRYQHVRNTLNQKIKGE